MDNLKGDFNSPGYKKGQRGSEASTPSKQATPEVTAKSDQNNAYESCLAAALPGASWNCTATECEREDARLNREYKRVMASYKAQGREDSVAELRKVEVAWLKSMTAECDSMTMQQAMYGCRLDWTKKRADEIAKLP